MQRILIIDDDQDILFATKKVLKRAGFDVSTAQDGEEGLSLFHTQDFDLVITDMIMPNKDGVEVIREVRSNKPEMKIMAISGGGKIGSEFYLKAASRFKVDLALHKPLETSEFVQKVQSVLN